MSAQFWAAKVRKARDSSNDGVPATITPAVQSIEPTTASRKKEGTVFAVAHNSTNGEDFPPLGKGCESTPSLPGPESKHPPSHTSSMNGEDTDEVWEGFQHKYKSRVGEHEGRIRELTDVVQMKDTYIGDLVAQLEGQDRYIAQLESEASEKDVQIQKLKDGLTAVHQQLKKTVDGQSMMEDRSVKVVEDPVAPTASDEPKAEVKPTPESVKELEEESDDDTKVELSPEVPTDAGEHKMRGQVLSPEAVRPHSPDMPSLPKSVTIPSGEVKPAPKVNIAIRHGGKIDTKTAVKAWVTDPDNRPGSLTGSAPMKDIRDMPLAERAKLFRGPTITILIGPEKITGVPKHMFMAVSPKAKDYFEQNPRETYLAFRVGKVAVPVMKLIVEWLHNMGSSQQTYSLKVRDNFAQDIAIRRDCGYLGMQKYVAHFTKKYCDKIRTGFPDFENIVTIEKNCADDDNLWLCLCNNLANMRIRKGIPEPEKFETFLEQHPRLRQAIGRIDTRLTMSRSAASSTVGSDSWKPQTNEQKQKGSSQVGKRKGSDSTNGDSQTSGSRPLRIVTEKEAANIGRR